MYIHYTRIYMCIYIYKHTYLCRYSTRRAYNKGFQSADVHNPMHPRCPRFNPYWNARGASQLVAIVNNPEKGIYVGYDFGQRP